MGEVGTIFSFFFVAIIIVGSVDPPLQAPLAAGGHRSAGGRCAPSSLAAVDRSSCGSLLLKSKCTDMSIPLGSAPWWRPTHRAPALPLPPPTRLRCHLRRRRRRQRRKGAQRGEPSHHRCHGVEGRTAAASLALPPVATGARTHLRQNRDDDDHGD